MLDDRSAYDLNRVASEARFLFDRPSDRLNALNASWMIIERRIQNTIQKAFEQKKQRSRFEWRCFRI